MNRGDTIIEVLLAITVFSLVSIAAITIMNQGTNAAQRALEITLVRQQIDGQAEAIRAVQQAAAGGHRTEWSKIAQTSSTSHYYSSPSAAADCPTVAQIPSGSFIMDARNATVAAPGTIQDINSSLLPYAQVNYAGGSPQAYGIWIERNYTASSPIPSLYSFTVNACWNGAGLKTPMKISTVVRLYDPGT